MSALGVSPSTQQNFDSRGLRGVCINLSPPAMSQTPLLLSADGEMKFKREEGEVEVEEEEEEGFCVPAEKFQPFSVFATFFKSFLQVLS